MDNREYLRHVVDTGREKAARTADKMQKDGWGKSFDSFLGVYCELAKMELAAQDYEYIAQGHANVWAVEMGSAAENGSFEAFVEGFGTARLSGDSLDCEYLSPSKGRITFGWNRPLMAEGKEVQRHGYKRYDNPFCQAEFDAAKLVISCGGYRKELDFER